MLSGVNLLVVKGLRALCVVIKLEAGLVVGFKLAGLLSNERNILDAMSFSPLLMDIHLVITTLKKVDYFV